MILGDTMISYGCGILLGILVTLPERSIDENWTAFSGMVPSQQAGEAAMVGRVAVTGPTDTPGLRTPAPECPPAGI